MHGGTPDSGTTHCEAYHFAIHEKVSFPNLILEENILTLKKGDTLVYSVITCTSSHGYDSEAEIKNEFDVRLYEKKYYVSTNSKDN